MSFESSCSNCGKKFFASDEDKVREKCSCGESLLWKEMKKK